MKHKQMKLFNEAVPREFGGSKLQGKRKLARPLSTKAPIHLVLKAKNARQLLSNRKQVEDTIRRFSKKFAIKIFELAVNADHIHLLVQISSKENYRRWIRASAGTLVRQISGLKWHLRPYTRLCTWGRELKRVWQYVRDNQTEAGFLISVEERVWQIDQATDQLFHRLARQGWRIRDPSQLCLASRGRRVI